MSPRARALVVWPVLLAACTFLQSCTPTPPLRVAVHPWIGYEPIFLARHFGWLPADMVLVSSGSLSESSAALLEGRADAAALTLDEVLTVRANGVSLTVVSVFNASAGTDVLLARAGLGLRELAGRRVGIEPSALGPLLLTEALGSVGLTIDDVVAVDLVPEAQLDAWRERQVDAVVSYEPTSSYLLREAAHVVFDSRSMPNMILDVLAVRSDRLGHPAVRGLLEAQQRGLRHLRINRQDALYRMAANQRLSFDEVERVLGGIRLPDLDANRKLLSHGRLLHAASQLNAIMVQRGLLPRADDLSVLVDPGILPDRASHLE